MPRMSKYLQSPSGYKAVVQEPPDETEAQESAESPTVDQVEKKAGVEKKNQKQPAKPSIAAMIRMAGMKRNRG